LTNFHLQIVNEPGTLISWRLSLLDPGGSKSAIHNEFEEAARQCSYGQITVVQTQSGTLGLGGP